MLKGRIQEIVIHPWFLALIVWVILVLIIPANFKKYRVKLIKDEYTSVNTSYYYYDLDSDGNSEQISLDQNDKGQSKIIVSKNGSILNQYNIPFQPSSHYRIYVDDYNNDRFKECYVFT